MRSIMEKNELLNRVERLSARRDYHELITLLSPLSLDFLLADLELGHKLALALFYTDEQLRAAELMQHLATRFHDRGNDRLFRAHRNLYGSLYFEQGELNLAEKLFLEVLATSTTADDQLLIASATVNLGAIADVRCQWYQAIASYQRAEAAYHRLGNRSAVAACHHNLGMAYRQMCMFSQADSHFNHAIEYYRTSGTVEEVVGSESERALLFHSMGDVTRAEAAARRALELARVLGNSRLEGESLRALAVALAECNRCEARDRLRQALDLAQRTNTRMLEAEVNEELAVLEMMEGETGAAEARADEAGRLFRSIGADARACRVIARLYRHKEGAG